MQKTEGVAKGGHCDNSNFISMLVCLIFFFFFSSFFSSLVCLFSSSPFKETTAIWMEYRITLLVSLCLHLFVHADLSHDHFCAGREKS